MVLPTCGLAILRHHGLVEGQGEGAGEPIPVAGLVVPLRHPRQLPAPAARVLEYVLEVCY